MKLRDILCWFGLIVGLIGMVYLFGACGGIEHELSDETWRVLAGLALIGLGAWSVKTALDWD